MAGIDGFPWDGSLKPQWPVEIDWNDELAHGLEFYCLCDENSAVADLVTGNVGIGTNYFSNNLNPRGRASADGPGIGIDGAATYQLVQFANDPRYNVLGEITVIWRGILDDTLGPSLVTKSVANGVGTTPFGLVMAATTPAFQFSRANSTFKVWGFNSSVPTAALVTIGASQGSDVSVAPAGYLNGIDDGAPTSLFGGSATGPPTGNTKPIWIGLRDDANGGGASMQISVAAIWSRQLSAAEHLAFHRAPFSMLRPTSSLWRVMPTAAVGGSFQAAWAVRPQVIGTGIF